MDFSDKFLQLLAVLLALTMGSIAAANWINRKHGGFARGWAGGVFIAICWFGALTLIVLRLQG